MKLSKLLLMGLLASGLMLSACNTKDNTSGNNGGGDSTDTGGDSTDTGDDTKPEEWIDIDYATFKAAYDARESAPWNHLDGHYGDEMGKQDDGSLKMFRVVEDLIDGVWTVDEALTENGGGDLTSELILSNEGVENYGNPPAGFEITFKRNGEQHRILIHAIYGGRTMETDETLDKYFYTTDHIQTADGQKVLECHVTWSIADKPVSPITLEGNKFVFKSKVEENIKIGDQTIITMPCDYIEFKEGGFIEAVSSYTEPEVTTAISKGTYNQNGSKFTYSFTGVEYNGNFVDYPDEMKVAYTNLEGIIDGNDITMTFAVLYEATAVYYHEIYTLNK